MKEFKIEPHVGVGPIRLGAPREAVHAALAEAGFPFKITRGSRDFFHNVSIEVEMDANGCAQFIGVSYHSSHTTTYLGKNVFDTPATELFELIAARDDSGTHRFVGSQYLFPNQIVTLWDADEQYDRLANESRVIWGQIGLGNQIYLDAIRQIKSRSA